MGGEGGEVRGGGIGRSVRVMVLEEPGVQQGGATAFRATVGAPSRAANTVVSLSGVRGSRITCTARDGQGIISESCDHTGGVQRGPGRGRLRGQSPLVVARGSRWSRADRRAEHGLQCGSRTTHRIRVGMDQQGYKGGGPRGGRGCAMWHPFSQRVGWCTPGDRRHCGALRVLRLRLARLVRFVRLVRLVRGRGAEAGISRRRRGGSV